VDPGDLRVDPRDLVDPGDRTDPGDWADPGDDWNGDPFAGVYLGVTPEAPTAGDADRPGTDAPVRERADAPVRERTGGSVRERTGRSVRERTGRPTESPTEADPRAGVRVGRHRDHQARPRTARRLLGATAAGHALVATVALAGIAALADATGVIDVDVTFPSLGTGAERPTPTAASVGEEIDPLARYVDCVGGHDVNDGSTSRPLRSLQALARRLPANASVYLRRGCSWDGGLWIRRSAAGTTVQPYGDGPAPVLTGTDVSRARGVVVVNAARVTLTGLHVRDAAGTGVEIRDTDARVDGLEIERVAFGVTIKGARAVVSRTRAHDLHMFTNTPGGSDDAGAVGFDVQADDVTIRNSSCVNCRARSHDFGHDGGFVEVFNHGDRLRVVGNTSRNTQGFLEVGGVVEDGSAHDIVIERNTISEAHGGVWVHRDDEFTIPARNIALVENTLTSVSGETLFGGRVSALVLRDNVIVTPNHVSHFGPPALHTGNRYHLTRRDRLGFHPDPTETVVPLTGVGAPLAPTSAR